MKTSKFTNVILEISQVLLVFLGVYSALMCAAMSLSLPVGRFITMIVILGVSFLFYGLFTVLETFRRGKLYGLLGISAFTVVVVIRFRSVVQKGTVTIINTYLKEFMSYTDNEVTLLSNRGFEQETASVEYCTTLVVILLAAYLTALISSCFYRKRRSSVYVAATVCFFLVPLTVGKIGYFSNVVTYLFVTIAVIGTRFLRFDTTDKRMRQKLSLVLLFVGLVAGTLTYVIVPPGRYDSHLNDIVEVKNSALAFTTWSREDFLTWMKEYFSGDALEYGKIGRKNQVNRSGRTLMKINGNFDASHGMYLKGYTGARYEQNRWHQVKEEQYESELSDLSADGLSLDNWHVTLRNQIGESQTTENSSLWQTGKIAIKNLAFGFGNYAVPYYPSTSFSSEGGRTTVAVPGVQYEVEYLPVMYYEMRRGLIADKYNLADNDYWTGSQENRDRLTAFAKKYYTGVTGADEQSTDLSGAGMTEELSQVLQEYKAYLNSQNGLLDKFNEGSASLYEVVEETRNFIMKDTEYTLSPGKTPKDKDAVVYFLKENKKGYNSHYATAAAVLLQGIGVPARYVEGLYISKERLADTSEPGQEVTVTDKDIHAWVEVYQENYGFLPLEFTPGMGDEDADHSPVTDEESEQGENGGEGGNGEEGGSSDGAHPDEAAVTPEPEDDMTFENIESDNYNREDQYEDEEPQVESGGLDEASPDDAEGGKSGTSWKNILAAVAIGLVLLVVAAEAQRRIRIVLLKKRMRKKTLRRQIIAYYRHMEKALIHKGIRYRGQSVDEYAGQIAQAYGMEKVVVEPFVSMVFCASFSYEKFDKEQIAEFQTSYRSIRHKVYEGVKGIGKLYYMYILCI